MVPWTTLKVVGTLDRARLSFESFQLQVHPALRVLVPQLVIHKLLVKAGNRLLTFRHLIDLLELIGSHF